ncbi:acid-sensing ion channel 1C-like isoform X2 [Amphiura filiformis]|uniref:acid-sensing ion channel 1C-like isoform X2 n=1 Tax=Amphiura filiformis TaxID=82378 RepID=UPI003B21B417
MDSFYHQPESNGSKMQSCDEPRSHRSESNGDHSSEFNNANCCEQTFLQSKIWEGFGQTTTLHGMRFFSNTKNHWLRRCIWMILVLGTISSLFFIVGFNCVRFFGYPISSIVTLKYVKNLTFPAVTICNYNQWRKSVIKQENSEFVSKFFFPVFRGNDSFNIGDYNVTDLNITAEVLRGAHQKENMIRDCTWRSVEKCTYENFTQIITDFGVCYTFNDPSDLSKILTVRQTGYEHGLFLRLNLEQYDYYYGERKGAGFKILVHAQGEYPFVKQLGFSIAPGFESLVGLKYTKLINLPRPYLTECKNSGRIDKYKYTVETCESLCAVEYLNRSCGCKYYNMIGSYRVCNAQEIFECVKPAQQQYILENPPCDCRIPCVREIYQPRVSEVTWPAPYITEELMRVFNRSEDFLRRNFMDVVIYFEELNYEEIEQVAAYDWTALLSDIGGYMGLLIGASVLTLAEFVDFAIVKLIETIQRKQDKTRPQTQRNATNSSMELC